MRQCLFSSLFSIGLFGFEIFHFILFHFILFYFILFHFILFYFILFYFISFQFISFYSNLPYLIFAPLYEWSFGVVKSLYILVTSSKFSELMMQRNDFAVWTEDGERCQFLEELERIFPFQFYKNKCAALIFKSVLPHGSFTLVSLLCLIYIRLYFILSFGGSFIVEFKCKQ